MRKSLNSNDKMNFNLNLNKKEENKTINTSHSSSKKLSSSRILLNQNKYRNDKVEKKLYLENINIKSHINYDLLSKLNSTFRSFNFQSGMNDPKIESNLFNIGSKRSILLRRSVNTVRNMIQDFDNQFSINFDFNNEKENNNINNIYNKYNYNYKTKQIKEESYGDFDFNLNKTNEISKDNDINNKIIKNKKNFFKEMKKGKKFLEEEESIERKLKNENNIIGLKNAFKYYELLYNYKYFLTEKDILCLSFNRRKKMEKIEQSKLLKQPKVKLDNYKEKCEKCEKHRKTDKFKYKNNLNIHLFQKNFSDSNIKNNNPNTSSKKILKRAFSGISNSNGSKSNNNFINNSNSKYSQTITRPTTASAKNFQKSNNKLNYNLSKGTNLNINISDISSKYLDNNSIQRIKSAKSTKNLSIKNKIENLSENILTTGDKLKNNLEEAYQNIMEKIEEDKKPVKKVKKKMKINIDKIRTDLNLRCLGEGFDENQMIMDNVDKLYKSLHKTHVNLMRSIAKILIEEERKKNKPSIYNYTHDKNVFRQKFKKEMFEASYKMKEIRKSLNKNKREKPFDEKLKHLLKNDCFIFFNIKSLKDEIDKIKVLRGEIIKN